MLLQKVLVKNPILNVTKLKKNLTMHNNYVEIIRMYPGSITFPIKKTNIYLKNI